MKSARVHLILHWRHRLYLLEPGHWLIAIDLFLMDIICVAIPNARSIKTRLKLVREFAMQSLGLQGKFLVGKVNQLVLFTMQLMEE